MLVGGESLQQRGTMGEGYRTGTLGGVEGDVVSRSALFRGVNDGETVALGLPGKSFYFAFHVHRLRWVGEWEARMHVTMITCA